MKNYESKEPCLVCNLNQSKMVTYHHIKTRKSGGTDDSHNLMPLCLWHHNEVHSIGLVSFSKKYPNVNNFLLCNGWEFVMGRWIYST